MISNVSSQPIHYKPKDGGQWSWELVMFQKWSRLEAWSKERPNTLDICHHLLNLDNTSSEQLSLFLFWRCLHSIWSFCIISQYPLKYKWEGKNHKMCIKIPWMIFLSSKILPTMVKRDAFQDASVTLILFTIC